MKNGPGELTISSGARSSSSRIEDFDALSDRIASALEATSANITSEKLAALVSEVDSSLTQLREDCAKTRELSLDPLMRSSAGARADVFDLEFKIERLDRAHRKLQEKHELVLSQEREAQERETRAALEQERDELAAELCEVYKQSE